MQNRREIVALGAGLAALGCGVGPAAAEAGLRPARLETRLFNFKPDQSEDQVGAVVARFKDRARAAGLDGFLIGRNFIPQQFLTRFEWIYMFQRDARGVPSADPALKAFLTARDALTSACRDQAQIDIDCPLPARYADAAGVKVRHVVTFNFKPDASPEARKRNVDAIRTMGALPMVRRYLVQPAAPDVVGPDQMQWQVIGDFASAADYKAYADAPVHLAIREDFKANTSRVAFLDVEL
jgi:hypothetical protein